uniref:protein REPRESSOR OF SILENCING 3 n=1 Tax=Erigeron canadensis TaxID=72917 RepID=UPI001CB90C1C|nr:protein REPRESSOR OF SILENCING 3 [Erigeron canadensis]
MMEGGEGLTKTRIYVGGLGGGVTEDDLRKTFSALGEVISVDVVRTKGRSFAYLDFLPSNDKSLPKLFSTYNGCMWKGGKLRLEKAKEHYLLRLKREWQEESEKASKVSDNCNTDAAKSHDSLEKPKKPSPADKTQINIFFPKLGKVKSLAQVGIGKHKYSFQRIEVPSTPTHFCDCEEHSLAFTPPIMKQSPEIEKVNYEVDEQELNIMNSVMNKIFERANPAKQVSRKSETTPGKDNLVVVETEADNLADEANLIINVANGKSDDLDMLEEMRTMMANRGPVTKKPTTSTEKPKIQKKTVSPPKKRKLPYSEENESGKTPIPATSSNSQTHVDTRNDGKMKVKSSTKQSDSNSLRSIKSTWKDMLGRKRKTSFNIADFIAQQKEEELKVIDTNHVSKEKNLAKKRKSEGDNELVSVSETTSANLLINKEPTSEVGAVITKNSISKTPANGYDQKDELKADSLEMSLTASGQQCKVSDVLSGSFNEKGEEPGNEDLDCNLEKLENDQDIELNEASPVKFDQDRKSLKEASPVKNEQDVVRTARGEFWRHKSSWTQLISTTSHSSFSISQIVPSLSFEKQEQQVDTSDPQPAHKVLDNQISTGKGVTSSPVKKNTSEKKRILSLRNLESKGTCSFMRTEDSMKEWKKAKASLSGSLNKKKRLANESA